MRASLTLGLALVLVAGALTGCGNQSRLTSPLSSGNSSSLDEAEVSAALASAPELVDDAVVGDSDPTTIDGAGTGLAAIRPLRFWRVIDSVDSRFVFAFGDTDSTGRPTTAHVTAHRYLRGQFDILATTNIDPAAVPDTDSVNVMRKRLADHAERHLLLKRVQLGNSGRWAWRVAAISGVQVTSFAPASPNRAPAYGNTRVRSLRVQAAALDTTVTDPLGLFRLRGVVRVDAGEPVTLTVTTDATDDVVVLMWHGLKFRFHNNGDRTYTGVWRAPFIAGLGHVGVNALSRGTLFDDAVPYDSQAWVLPYVVRPTMLAEYLP